MNEIFVDEAKQLYLSAFKPKKQKCLEMINAVNLP